MPSITQSAYLAKAKEKHGSKYDYSLLKYTRSRDKITVICPTHGDFIVTADGHLKYGCRKCYDAFKNRSNASDFITKATKLHGDLYDYSCSNYVKNNVKVKIMCKKHGVFEQIPSNHLSGSGCKECQTDLSRKTTEVFIEEASVKHGGKYDYSKTIYTKAFGKVIITCPKHGDFSQSARDHLHSEAGCPACKESKGEREIRKFLSVNSISFTSQKRFDSCRDKYPLPFDFYLPDLQVLIEYQGIQHHQAIDFFGGRKEMLSLLRRDEIKKEWAIKNNLNLVIVNVDDNINKALNFIKEAYHGRC